MPFPNGESVGVRRRTQTGTDAHNNATYSWSTIATVANCGVAPRNEGDVTDHGRQGVITGLTFYLPYGTDVTADDLLVYDDEEFRIVGDVGAWRSPYSGVGRVLVVNGERVEG